MIAEPPSAGADQVVATWEPEGEAPETTAEGAAGAAGAVGAGVTCRRRYSVLYASLPGLASA